MAPGSCRQLSGLERYSEYFNAVEINSTFYRPPRIATLERWRDSTPATFRFTAKMPRTITHEAGLIGARAETNEFCALISRLGPKLGALLVQLPPSLELDARAAARFFRHLVLASPAAVVLEPRHPSWFSARADDLLARVGVGRVAADPSLCPSAAEPAGEPGVSYFRWHGSPQMYFSAYTDEALVSLAARAKRCCSSGCDVYCIFDNTALGAAAVNGLALRAQLDRARGAGLPRAALQSSARSRRSAS